MRQRPIWGVFLEVTFDFLNQLRRSETGLERQNKTPDQFRESAKVLEFFYKNRYLKHLEALRLLDLGHFHGIKQESLFRFS